MYDVKEWVGAPDGHAISSLDERSDGKPWLGRRNTILHVVIQYASASSGSTLCATNSISGMISSLCIRELSGSKQEDKALSETIWHEDMIKSKKRRERISTLGENLVKESK